MPVIVDELQSKGSPGGGQAGKRMVVEDLLYLLSLGHERGALNSDRSMMRAGSWKALTIATGEIPVVGDATQQGAANRTLEISAEPFGDVRAAQAMHHLVAEQHGTAGRAFVAAEIERRCEARHSARAVEMRTSRIHCSLMVRTVCPECGAVGVTFNRQTKMCPRGAPSGSTWSRSGRSPSSWSGRGSQRRAARRWSGCVGSGTRFGSRTRGRAGSTG